MKLLVCLVSLCWGLAVSAPLGDSELDKHWELWKNWHQKSYHEAEESWRKTVWEENLKAIEMHNLEQSLGLHTYRLGMNQFGDLTNEEFQKILTGERHFSKGKRINGSAFLEANFVQVPTSVDWRDHGYVTPVKNQGHCGSCWAFSTTGALEGQLFQKSGQLVSLSEQNLVDCSWQQGNEGCNGGIVDFAFQYILENRGIDSEDCYPYTAKDTAQCAFKPECATARVTGFVDIPPHSEEALMKAVATVGPVSVAIDAHPTSFRFYQSGIFYEPKCSSERLNHAVLVVGYGYEGKDEAGKKYWIVKNSWGKQWGDHGYVYLSKDRGNHCGIATTASYPLL
ncbi:procathepsin L-like [Tachyglossus aculeatus]|uniref:procathepsin L-like n=1 Tax=Tachyglossus aculeatus TaxID=9261 RepID=UPI0018F2AA2D|nr:procathepsin L-like [Tachyglossus aculeatus]